MDEDVAIGRLRWLMTLALRTQVTSGTGTLDQVTAIQQVHADIQPTGAVTYYGIVASGEDGKFTHRIFIRWLDWIDARHIVMRDTVRPDGSVRQERYRIWRVQEITGRKRFCLLECELEARA